MKFDNVVQKISSFIDDDKSGFGEEKCFFLTYGDKKSSRYYSVIEKQIYDETLIGECCYE